MSWQFELFRVPDDCTNLSELPNDFVFTPIGQRAEIGARLQALFPEGDFSDPRWGVIKGPGFAIEVYFDSDDVVKHMSLNVGLLSIDAVRVVRGGSEEEALHTVQAVIDGLGIAGFEVDGLERFTIQSASERWQRSQAYRDDVYSRPPRRTPLWHKLPLGLLVVPGIVLALVDLWSDLPSRGARIIVACAAGLLLAAVAVLVWLALTSPESSAETLVARARA